MLAAGGSMHEGAWSARLGIPGQPAEAEEVMVMRDIALARMTGGRVHFQHLSTRRSVDLVAAAKAEGLAVTCEATPAPLHAHRRRAARRFDPVFKVNPPLRTDDDVAAVRAGPGRGTIDCIATDHAPHAPETKEQPFDQAPPGMLGLETALALALTHLDLPDRRGAGAAVVAPGARSSAPTTPTAGPSPRAARPTCASSTRTATWTVDAGALASRSRNTPYAGMELTGRVRHTILAGEPVVVDGEAQR